MAILRLCSIPDCGKPVTHRGWCNAHYSRWYKYGAPDRGGPARATRGATENFILTVALVYDQDDCLLWPFGTAGKGYGRTRYGGKTHLVHRLVCELAHGACPTKYHQAAHNCGNRQCCNPNHLRWASPAENQADRLMHGTDCRGSRSPSSVLTEDDVLAIRDMVGSATYEQIGQKFGVSASAAHRAATGVTWTDLA